MTSLHLDPTRDDDPADLSDLDDLIALAMAPTVSLHAKIEAQRETYRLSHIKSRYILRLAVNTCACGAVHTTPEGLYEESTHPSKTSRTLKAIPAAILSHLPRVIERTAYRIPICHECAGRLQFVEVPVVSEESTQ